MDFRIHMTVNRLPMAAVTIESWLHVDRRVGVEPQWDMDEVVRALRWLPIWALGHNGRDRLQFSTIRPLSEKEWRRLGELGARVFLLDETTHLLRW